MAENWSDFLNNTAQGLIGLRVAELTAPGKQVTINAATGKPYVEGQPYDALPGVAGISPMVLAAGAVLVLLVGYVALRK